MGNTTKVSTITIAGALATLLVYVLGAVWPDVRMPAGLEAAVATLIAAGAGFFLPPSGRTS